MVLVLGDGDTKGELPDTARNWATGKATVLGLQVIPALLPLGITSPASSEPGGLLPLLPFLADEAASVVSALPDATTFTFGVPD